MEMEKKHMKREDKRSFEENKNKTNPKSPIRG